MGHGNLSVDTGFCTVFSEYEMAGAQEVLEMGPHPCPHHLIYPVVWYGPGSRAAGLYHNRRWECCGSS